MTSPTGDLQAQKSAARGPLLQARTDHPEATDEQRRRTSAVLAHLDVLGARTVALYVSVATEPDTAELRTQLASRGVAVLLPILQDDDTLEFGLDQGPLLPGRRGIPVPAGPAVPLQTADAVVVPALAVDRDGVRLGRGGGSYDRALAGRRRGAPVIALLRTGELLVSLPAEPHDVRVDAAALPNGIVELPGRV